MRADSAAGMGLARRRVGTVRMALLLGGGLLLALAMDARAVGAIIGGGGPGAAARAIVAFLASALVLADALVWVGARFTAEHRRASGDQASRMLPLVWLGMTVGAILVWQAAFSPDRWPLRSLFFWVTLAAFPAILAERGVPGSFRARFARLWRAALVAVGLSVGGFLAIRYAIMIRPYIESVDFYYYVCIARDLAAGAADGSVTRYFYSPGVYAFWRAALRAGDGSLATLQWTYLGLLAANALVVALIVRSVRRSLALGLLAALWYVTFASRFEGFFGTTEPLATLPVLVGLLAWGGRSLAGRAGMARAIALGIGIGLGVYAKQQGGLLALGWLAMVAANVRRRPEDREPWSALAAIPAAATAAFLLLILLEGHGLEPIRLGLSAVSRYEAEGDLIRHLLWLKSRDDGLTFGASLAVGLCLALLVLPRYRSALSEPWARVLGFATVAGMAGLLQFTKRAYLHYAMLLGPLLIIAVVIAVAVLARWTLQRLRAPAFASLLAVGLAVLPVTQPLAGPIDVALSLWPPVFDPPPFHLLPSRFKPDIMRDIAALRGSIRAGEDTLVLPPRRNEVHFLLGTRSLSLETGYGWARPEPGVTLRAIHSPGLKAVVVIRHGLDEADRTTWRWFDGDAAVTELPRAGFRPAVETPTLTLWRRD